MDFEISEENYQYPLIDPRVSTSREEIQELWDKTKSPCLEKLSSE